MQMTNKERNLIFFLVVVMIIVININLVITPGMTKRKELKDQLLVAEDSKFQTEQLLGKANTIDSEIEQILLSTQDMIPPFFNVVDKEYIHMWIGALANKNQVTVDSLTITEPQVTVVTPYIKTITPLSYPIGEYFNNIVNSTTLEAGAVEETPQTSTGEGVDQVVKTDLILNLKGTKAKIMNLVSEISHLEKHGIVNNVAFATFDVDDEKTTSITVSLYSIHKENDGIFDYEFK